MSATVRRPVNQNSVRQSEKGMVSLLVTMILMLVITLIVIGFSQVSRRNQRESLDNQLATQAFYAAESGVNEARSLLQTAIAAGSPVFAKTDCVNASTNPGDPLAALNSNVSADGTVKYSCLLVDPAPTVLRYTDVGSNSTVIPLAADTGENLASVKLTWQAKNNATPISTGNCPAATANVFKPADAAADPWTCGYGVLRLDLVPTQGNLTVSGLAATTMTTFAVPQASGGITTPISFPSPEGSAAQSNPNKLIGVHCDDNECSLTINGLSRNSYHLRVSSIYNPAALQVSAKNAAGTDLKLVGAQALIDSTGKAQDVLRRIRVHVPLRASSENALSDYAMQSTDSICKRFAVLDNYYSSTMPTGVSGNNRLCQTVTP